MNDAESPIIYTSRWFVALFWEVFTFETTMRIWDLFLFYGYRIVHAIGLALLKTMEGTIPFKEFSLKFHGKDNCCL